MIRKFKSDTDNVTYQLRRPLQVALSHQPPDAPVSRGIGHKEAAVTHMTAPTRIIRFDIETPQASLFPIRPLLQLLDPLHLAQQHDRPEILEPIGAKFGQLHGNNHGIGITLFDLAVQLVAQVREERGGDLGGGAEGEKGGHGDAVTERYLAGGDCGGQGGGRAWVGGCARGAVDGRPGWVVEHGRHFGALGGLGLGRIALLGLADGLLSD